MSILPFPSKSPYSSEIPTSHPVRKRIMRTTSFTSTASSPFTSPVVIPASTAKAAVGRHAASISTQTSIAIIFFKKITSFRIFRLHYILPFEKSQGKRHFSRGGALRKKDRHLRCRRAEGRLSRAEEHKRKPRKPQGFGVLTSLQFP